MMQLLIDVVIKKKSLTRFLKEGSASSRSASLIFVKEPSASLIFVKEASGSLPASFNKVKIKEAEKEAVKEAEASLTKFVSGNIFLKEAEIFPLKRLKHL